jgi:hypothetical protein
VSERRAEERPVLRRRGKLLFIGIQLVVWALLAGLALEVYTVFQWQRIEAKNPYVRARHGEVTWPDSDNVPPEEPIVVAVTPPEERLPQPTPLEEWRWRADYFLSLPPEDRATFARVYAQNIYMLNAQGEITEAYLHPPVNGLPSSIAEHSGEAIEDYVGNLTAGHAPVPAEQHFEAEGLTLRALPMPGEEHGLLLIIDGAFPKPSGITQDIYEEPWFSYRKHASLPSRHFSPEDLGSEQFSTNNFGFRDRDVLVPKPEDTFRIVCVGASTTEEGMNNAYTYPNLLEAELNAHFATPVFDVINAGIAGLNISKERMRLADYLAMDPDIIIAYNAVNDIAHFHFLTWINQATSWQRLLRKSKFITYHFNNLFRPDDAAIRDALIHQTISQLFTIHERAAEVGVTVVLTTFARPDIENLPPVQRDYFDLYAYDLYNTGSVEGRLITFATYCHTIDLFNEALREICRERDIPLIDIAAAVSGGTEIFGDVCHMRNRGIEAKARAVFEQLTGPLAALLPADVLPAGQP